MASLAYSSSGKSFAALSENDPLNPELIPSHYGLYFKIDTDPLEPTPYHYVELRSDPDLNQSKQLYSMEKKFDVPGTFLKSILLKESPEDEGELVESAWIVFVPPFSRVLFASEETIGPLKEIEAQSNYHSIELEFAYKDKPQTTVIKFDTGKTLTII